MSQDSSDKDAPQLERRLTYQRLRRLAAKEIREILRDRRTVVTLILMPLLLYPMLSLAFHRFLLSSLAPGKESTLVVAVDSASTAAVLSNCLAMGDRIIESKQENASAETKNLPALNIVEFRDLVKVW